MIYIDIMSKKIGGRIGDPHLKRYKTGTLDTKTPVSEIDKLIFHDVCFGYSTAQIAEKYQVNIQSVFDIVKRVGRLYESIYKIYTQK